MKRINLKHIIVCCIALLAFAGCNDLDQIPTNKFTDETFWQSADNSELVVNMAYNQMYSAGRMWRDESLSDNMFDGRGNTAERLIRNGVADPSLGRFADEWKDCYGGIKTCHAYLQNIDRVPDMDARSKEVRKAEIRFIRAFLFFRLSNFYGDIPFFTQDITLEESKVIRRTPRAKVIEFIHNELDAIIDILPKRDDLETKDNGRITKGAACALQARVYLYESNWAKVEEYAGRLINEQPTYGTYALFPSYSGLFLAENQYNTEVILDCGYVPSLRTWSEMYDRAPISAGARLNQSAPTQSLVDNYLTLDGKTIAQDATYDSNNPYINRDPRLTATVVYHLFKWSDDRTIYIKPGTGGANNLDLYVGPSANTTSTGYYVKKYYDPTAETGFKSGLNIIMFRYADILLMYAEAIHEQRGMPSEIWDITVKPVRKRAGFTTSLALDYPAAASKEQIREIIRNERRSEFAIEGLRFFDIQRWKAGTKYLNGYVMGAKFVNNNTENIRLDNRRFDENRDYLWSVPRSQMDLNPNLKPNNPGYAN